MLDSIIIVTSCMQIGHFSRHWVRVTQGMMEDARDARLKAHLNWNDTSRRRGSRLRN